MFGIMSCDEYEGGTEKEERGEGTGERPGEGQNECEE
jgi:hypothetical protein